MKKIIKTFNPKLHPEYDYVDIKLYTLASDIGVSSRTIQPLNDSITDSVYTHSTESDLIKAATPFINYIDNIFKDSLN